MKNKANKTFLDTLLDDTQQNTLSSLYALEPTHNGVNQRAIYEAQDVNTSITGKPLFRKIPKGLLIE